MPTDINFIEISINKEKDYKFNPTEYCRLDRNIALWLVLEVFHPLAVNDGLVKNRCGMKGYYVRDTSGGRMMRPAIGNLELDGIGKK
uniref:Uncharacterized protein n=1 Tax=Heterorhabditis bacteriophora TaxID=37862 RepID=A0A1I7WV78_HETBA